jgi:hypothetical protein
LSLTKKYQHLEKNMSWESQLKGNPLSWLLESGNPGVRYLALRDLADLPADDAELQAARKAAHREGPIAAILDEMDPSGYWVITGAGYNPKYRSTAWSILLLAQLGARLEDDSRLAQACSYLLEHGLAPGGQFTTTRTGAPSGTIDCLQGNLCWSLLELGCEDPRLETAFEWMARSVTGEGLAPAEETQAERRYYAYKYGPVFACGVNAKQPCAWGAVKVMLALARLPKERRTPLIESAIQQGIDFLFSTDPAGAKYPTRLGDPPSRNWWKFGFPVFYITDLLQLVEALVALGYGHDPRLAQAIQIIRDKQDEQGRWALEYDYKGKTWVDFGAKKQPNPWVTLRALRVLKALSTNL